jgi:small subunit ribosomal protein S16
MLTLRLARAGTKKRPVYHLVATDSRSRRDGRFIENLGYYIPSRNVLVLKHDRVEYWLSVGARSSETAGQIIAKSKRHGNVQPAAKPKYQAPPKAVAAEAPPPPPPPKAPENAVEKTE